MKFIRPLSDVERRTLEEAYRHHPSFRTRVRAHALLLNARGYRVARLRELFEVEHETVSGWLDGWERHGIVGLFDRPRSGRPRRFSDAECQRFVELIDERPHQCKVAAGELQHATGKTASPSTFKRMLKKAGYRWKRCRRSLHQRRDEAAFRREHELQQRLRAVEEREQVRIVYFDEAGFDTTPAVPYAWQPNGCTRRLPSQRSRRLNVLGFIGREPAQCRYFQTHPGSVDTETVIAAFDAFARYYAREHYEPTGVPCIVLLDNASMHRSDAFAERIESWLTYGVAVHFLPPYSPELNLIEILWRRIKYQWLPFDAYQSYDWLKYRLQEVLEGIGTKFRISFA